MAEDLWDRVAAGQRPIIADPRVIAADATVGKELVLTNEVGITGRMTGRHQHTVEPVDIARRCRNCTGGDQLV